MVGVAQSVERRIVAPEVVGSIPIVHPMLMLVIVIKKLLKIEPPIESVGQLA